MASISSGIIKFPELTQSEAKETFKKYSEHYCLDTVSANTRTDLAAQDPNLDPNLLDEKALTTLINSIYKVALQWSSKLRAATKPIPLSKNEITDTYDISALYMSNLTYHDLSIVFKDATFKQKAEKEGFESYYMMTSFFNTTKQMGTSRNTYFESTACECVSLCSEFALFKLPEFKDPSKIKYLDLRNSSLRAVDLGDFTALEELRLGCASCPKNLPRSLQKLYLNIKPYGFQTFVLQFDRLPPKLEFLDISYAKNLKIEDSFWQLLDKRKMTIVISSNMEVLPTSSADLSEITFKDQFDNAGKIENGKVVFLKKPDPKSFESTPQKSPESKVSNSSAGFKLFKWLSFAAVFSALAYGLMKLWPRLRKI